ncbi:esterase/lipase family protein [Shumkonia mesophila]|uniref:esterase/lipase family protein n=1 Tax=Shumkonia mesophila TaxID=2838854 RepID=UPI0029352459|nr:hypothetical protein [Shumkonia mesophila]
MGLRSPLLVLLALLSWAPQAAAENTPPKPADPFAALQRAMPDLMSTLLRDRMVWGDLAVRHGWRIQQEGLTGGCRILDTTDKPLVQGDCDAALSAFTTMAPAPDQADRSPLVVLVHGYNGARHDLLPLARHLSRAGMRTETVALPTFLAGVDQQARRLNAVIATMGGSGAILFIAHSMGGLVVRRALADRPEWMARGALGAVFIGTPFGGSVLARIAADLGVAPLGGPAVRDLLPLAAEVPPSPPARWCVIAGGNGGEGWNPLIPGDDDGMIAVDETRLAAGEDRVLIRAMHVGILRHPTTLAAVERFARGGLCAGAKDS